MYKRTEINFHNQVEYWMGEGALNEAASLLNQYANIYVLVDENTAKNCLPVLQDKWPRIKDATVIDIVSGEDNKTLLTVDNIWFQLTRFQADRHSLLVNLGGGVITDMGGFAAAAFKRGMKFVHVPTTLLAQVDAAIGGKTGVDFSGFKNHIGFFKDPEAVVIDPIFLQTLDERQRRSGFAEVMKYGLIMDEDLWHLIADQPLENISPAALEEMIVRSVENKIKIVAEDSQESGLRKILNFGHTLGHALETYFLNTANPITHGEAVAAGMICESWISHKLTGLDFKSLVQIEGVINRVFARLNFTEQQISAILNLTRQDKKVRDGKIRYSLLEKVGNSVFDVEVEDQLAEESLRYYIQKTNWTIDEAVQN